MGWGQQIRPGRYAAADALARSVRDFIRQPTTGRREAMEQALARYDAAAVSR